MIFLSCKKDSTAFDERKVLQFEHGVIGYVSKSGDIELKGDNSIFLKEVITNINGAKLVQYFSTDGELYHEFKVGKDGIPYDLVVFQKLPLKRLFNTMSRELIEPLDLELDLTTYKDCMNNMLRICISERACSFLFALASPSMSLGWSLRCVFH